jgi:hypothetical integral membrane protein (TIGR02206 family)
VTVYSRALGLVVLAAWAGEYAADVLLGTWTLQYSLPLQLTDAVSLATVLALWSRRTIFIELVYFWSLTASLQATLTPDLAQNFPSIYYFTYFSYHIGAVAAACLLVFGLRLYPRPRAAWRVFAVTVGWATVAGLGDVVTGGNYMYLRVKPVHSSLLSVMGAWPWYLASTAALGLGMLLVLQALANWLNRRDASPPVPSGTVADRGVARTGQARA